MKSALVIGAGGFIGHHMANRLKQEGYYVTCMDLEYDDSRPFNFNDRLIGDASSFDDLDNVMRFGKWDEVYQFAADMGGAEFIFSGSHDADIMSNSASININVARACVRFNVKKVFFSSSACAYSEDEQQYTDNAGLKEDDAYPANPDSEYGWEKIFSERLYMAYERNYGLKVRIARLHNIFGPEGTFRGERAKAPAAICRKVAEANNLDEIEIFGDGCQTRSFLYIDECIEGIRQLMTAEDDTFCNRPLNIGSSESISINDLAKMVIEISGKKLTLKHVSGPQGVRGRNSDNTLVKEVLGWEPFWSLRLGMEKLYHWVNKQVNG
jgi:nucleoside-diphosphate-sugar epimerase